MSKYLKTDLNDTICALATAGGVGAIGVIRISGIDAIKIVNEIFKGKNLQQQQTHTVHFGKIIEGEKIIDEVLATIFVSPKSYTGENTVELSCHGSAYIQQQILELLVKKGARLAKPGEFTLRAFLNKKLDLSQAEAVADLIASNSAETHKTAMQQMRGGFSNQIHILKEKLVNFASLIELELDFAEEDVEFASKDELRKLVTDILILLNELIISFQYGNVIKNGIPTVIAGKPNAGKSTLLNALLNEERAIVSHIAGTTRDTIEEVFVIDGVNFRLTDTAGIRNSTDSIESIGIEKTFEKIGKASVILYLFDASTTSNKELENELEEFKKFDAVVIPVGNKMDLIIHSSHLTPHSTPLTPHSSLLTPIYISSLHKKNIHSIIDELKKVVEKSRVNNDVVITNIRHFEALKNAAESLQQVLVAIDAKLSGEMLSLDIRKAIFHLAEIVGEVTTEDLLGNIFSKFCIGK
jgi:tRNA modification GTPase